MGCCESTPKAPEMIMPDPSGPSEFHVKRSGTFGDNFKVKDAQGHDWLFMDNTAGVQGMSDGKLALENYVRQEGSKKGERLGFLEIDCDIKAGSKKEIEEDSDSDSDEEETEYEVKLKWKVKRDIKIKSRSGETVATLKSKISGKSKAEHKVKEEDGRTDEDTEVSTKIKKVEYTLKFGEEVEIDTKHGKWDDEDRKWDCSVFFAEYDDRKGKDVTIIKTKEGHDPAVALLAGFAVSNFSHPATTASCMEARAVSQAKGLARKDQNH
eukprot:TRINITY_DN58181_c0_g1_i1.p1 TRINITY_DN58181_c0_g1~~TRINITY_DN58181_c0_g1_i1.p1  ORF type:complete len:267 (+),score=130.98 TRINITY_DN58181_c0_g1_i1:63-863(+)